MRTDKTTLKEIKDVWQDWKDDRHRWRSSHAMVKISTILKAETEDVKS